MLSMKKRNLVASLFLFLFCAGYAYATYQLPTRAIENSTQPSFFPWVIVVFLFVFKPFYKIDKSRSQKSSSVGLGLSISSDIIRSHGGKIELSNSKFGGLKVTISLPF